MDSAFDVSDSTDWNETSIPLLAGVDASLRCQVCKDYFNNPVITSCFHTFCSLCIRRCLAADGQCPACRSAEQENRLRRNVAVQEVADAFVAARQSALDVARQAARQEEEIKSLRTTGKTKRKREAEEEATGSQSGPRTRSQRRKADAQIDGASEVMVIDEDNEDADFVPEDGLVACPICNQRMKAEEVFLHLDRCENDMANGRKPLNHKPARKSTPITTKQLPPQPPPERLPQLSYSLLNEKALRKKLSELGISGLGSKSLLIRRHTEWIALWNSNCDSPRPRSKKELLTELDTWERSQGRHALNGGSGQPSAVMRKDFDGEGWARKNKDEFDLLIANARQKRKVYGSGGNDVEKSDKPAQIEPDSSIPATQPTISTTAAAVYPTPLDGPRNSLSDMDNLNASSPRSPPSIYTQLHYQPPNQARRASAQLDRNTIPIAPHDSQRPSTGHDPKILPNAPKMNGIKPGEPAPLADESTTETPGNQSQSYTLNSRGAIVDSENLTRKLPMFTVPSEPIIDSNETSPVK